MGRRKGPAGTLDAKATARTTSPDRGIAFWTAQRPRYLLSGLITSAACGGCCSVISATHVGCSAARNKGPTACRDRRTIKREAVEEKVLQALRSQLMAPEVYRSFVKGFTAEWNKAQVTLAAEQDGKRDELARAKTGIKRLIDAIEAGAAVEVIKQRLAELQARKTALEAELARVEVPAPRLMPNLSDIFRDKVAALVDVLEQDGSDAVHDARRSLVQEIRLVPDPAGATPLLAVDACGACGDTALASGSIPEAAAALASQMKLVAGAGFEPAAFRL